MMVSRKMIAWREADKQNIAAGHLFHLGHAMFEAQHILIAGGFPGFKFLQQSQLAFGFQIEKPGEVIHFALQRLGKIFNLFVY